MLLAPNQKLRRLKCQWHHHHRRQTGLTGITWRNKIKQRGNKIRQRGLKIKQRDKSKGKCLHETIKDNKLEKAIIQSKNDRSRQRKRQCVSAIFFVDKNSDSGLHSSSQLSFHKPITKIHEQWKMPSHSFVDWLACIDIKNGSIIQCREKWEQRQFQRREKIFAEPIFATTEAFEKEYKKFSFSHEIFTVKHCPN